MTIVARTLVLAAFLNACGLSTSTAFEPTEAVTATDDQLAKSVRFSTFRLTTHDGLKLEANLWMPQTNTTGGTLPALIFVNSWALNSYEYTAQAVQFAKQGYVVLSYATRGFGSSDGVINVAGPEDIDDLSAAIDWLVANTPTDPARIGMSGISYGGGISLLGAAFEPRIKTVVAMSAFTDLERAINGNGTPRLVWGLLLIGSGYFTGTMDPRVARLYGDILKNENLNEWKSFAAERSVSRFTDRINASHKPIYISSNLQDELFQPNPIVDFFNQLTGPKRLDLSRGEHATAEVSGLLGSSDNYIWVKTHAWFDHYLKGVDNGIELEPQVTVQRKFSDERLSFQTWPSNRVSTKTYYLSSGLFNHGSLVKRRDTTATTDWFLTGVDTTASTGFPVLSAVLESHTPIDVYTTIDLINPLRGLVYSTAPLNSALKLRGAPVLHLPIIASGGTAGLVAYLYDVDAWGTGRLVTHGVASLHDANSEHPQTVDLDLNFIAHDIRAGHSLAIAIDSVDLLYAAPDARSHQVDLVFDGPTAPSLSIAAE